MERPARPRAGCEAHRRKPVRTGLIAPPLRPARRPPISGRMTEPTAHRAAPWHGTTILSARTADKVVVIGDGQVSMGQTVMKPNAKKDRKSTRLNSSH